MFRLSLYKWFFASIALLGSLFGIWFLIQSKFEKSDPVPLSSWIEITGPQTLITEASAGTEGVWKITAPTGAQGIRILLGDPLRIVKACDANLPAGGTCDLILRLPSGSPDEGMAQIVVLDDEGRQATVDVSWRRTPDPLLASWEVITAARPDAPGVGRLWIQNRLQEARPFPTITLPDLITRAEGPGTCPSILPPQSRCALTLRWTGRENGILQLQIKVPGAAPIEVDLPSEGFDPLPRWSPLAPFVADPALGPGLQNLEISNAGQGPLNLTPIRIDGPGFTIVNNTCPERLPPGLSCSFLLSFQADADMLAVGRLRIGESIDLPLHGQAEGYAPRLAFEGETTVFATAGDTPPILRLTVRLRNIGTRPSAPIEVRHVGSPLPGGTWAWDLQTCPALAPGEACDLVQEGTATENGFTETFLEAPGVPPYPLRWAITNLSPSLSIDLPGAMILETNETSVVRDIHLRNTGNASARLSPTLEGIGYTLDGDTCGIVLRPGQSCILKVRWTPPQGVERSIGRLQINSETSIDLMALRR